MSGSPFDFANSQPVAADDDNYTPSRRRGEPPKTRLVYILLALFLGLLGVHNFYAGRVIQGVAQLGVFVISWPLMFVIVGFVTLAFVALWVLLDIVSVKKDGRGKWMV